MSTSRMQTGVIERTDLPLPLLSRGKVRDIYAVDDRHLLIVTTDRISAFDVVLSPGVPSKGQVLTCLTAWWLARMKGITHHHLITIASDDIARRIPVLEEYRHQWAGRAMLVHRAITVPIECVVRGYITGSAWKEYRRSGTLAGEPLPKGLKECQRLDPPIFSPATKAEEGHDENITFDEMSKEIGLRRSQKLKRLSLELYERGREIAGSRGIILADTKFEFGFLSDSRIALIDEVLTPDSSRFWPQESYEVGRGQPSLDKQPVRDYLQSLVQKGEWGKEPPAPELPRDVVAATSGRYVEILKRLTGWGIENFPVDQP